MNAQEARTMAKEVSEKPDVSDIITRIQLKAANGHFEMWYYESINEHQAKYLKEEGYEIEDLSCQRDGVLYKISW